VCLDLDKIKFCCFCACRVCFNKYAKEHTILCDRCNQEYHTFCVGLPGVPEGDWVCPACIDGDRKKVQTEKRRKERDARKKVDDEKRFVADAKKAEASAKRKTAKAEKKKLEEERKRVDRERRKAAADNRKQKEAEMRAAGIILPKKRGPGRPSKAEMAARLEAEQRHQEYLAAQSGSNKRGRGRPRKDGKDPIPRMFPSKSEISMDNLHLDIATAVGGQRSRSGRKIQRTIFHDEVGDSGGLSLVAERSAAVAASRAIHQQGPGGVIMKGTGKNQRKPGARECMQLTRKFTNDVIEKRYFDTLYDYANRGKIDHIIRMRERLDEHSRYLESQLAGLEALVAEKGESMVRVPPVPPRKAK